MTLCQLLFNYFVDAGCAGNKNRVARVLGISRRRVNSISCDLNNGAGLASTMTRLLCEYRRSRLDINGIVDLYLNMEDADKSSGCVGTKMLAEARDGLNSEDDALATICTEMHISLRWVAGHIGYLYCRERGCSKEYGEKCPCWWLVGLIDSIKRLEADDAE